MSLITRRPKDADDADENTRRRSKGATATKQSRSSRGATSPKTTKGRTSSAEPKAPGASPGAKSPTQKKQLGGGPRPEGLAVGAEPRVDLLPPEVRAERRNARTRRGFGWGVVAVLLVVLVATGGAFSLNVLSQTKLLAAQSETASILAQQKQYAPVRDVQKQVALAQAAQQAGVSTEIDWKAFLDQVGAAQPAGLELASVSVDSAAPTAIYPQSTDPLQGPRVGTVTVVGTSAALPDVPAWVGVLQKIPGVVDVVPGTVVLDDVKNIYKATVTIHVSDALYTKRFEPKGK